MVGSIERLFLLVKGYFESKRRGSGDAPGKGTRGNASSFEKSTRLFVESPVKLDIFIPRVVRILIDVIIAKRNHQILLTHADYCFQEVAHILN